MLQQMGWRPGQGIGPREKRKQKSIIKVYGCALPSSQGDSEVGYSAESYDKSSIYLSQKLE